MGRAGGTRYRVVPAVYLVQPRRRLINNDYRCQPEQGQGRASAFVSLVPLSPFEEGSAMKTPPRLGLSAEERRVVDATNRITFADDRMPSVLATPWLIAYLEYASRAAIAGCLEATERSVGTFVEV